MLNLYLDRSWMIFRIYPSNLTPGQDTGAKVSLSMALISLQTVSSDLNLRPRLTFVSGKSTLAVSNHASATPQANVFLAALKSFDSGFDDVLDAPAKEVSLPLDPDGEFLFA
jgi:hypothetical protein